jgi:hypothetical protein
LAKVITLHARHDAQPIDPSDSSSHAANGYPNQFAVMLGNERRRIARANQLDGLIEREPVVTHRYQSRLLPQTQDGR